VVVLPGTQQVMVAVLPRRDTASSLRTQREFHRSLPCSPTETPDQQNTAQKTAGSSGSMAPGAETQKRSPPRRNPAAPEWHGTSSTAAVPPRAENDIEQRNRDMVRIEKVGTEHPGEHRPAGRPEAQLQREYEMTDQNEHESDRQVSASSSSRQQQQVCCSVYMVLHGASQE